MSRLQGYLGGFDTLNFVSRQSLFETKIVAVRDRIRTAFDLAAGDRTKVGDVFRWQGTNGNKWGYGFQIRHYNAGVATGHEWTLFFAFSIDSLTYVVDWMSNNDSQRANHFRRYDGNTGVGFNQPKMFMYYSSIYDGSARFTASGTSGTIAPTDPVFRQGTPTNTAEAVTVNSATDIVFRMTGGRKFRSGDILEVASGPNAGATFTVNGESEANFLDIGYDTESTMSFAAEPATILGYDPRTQINNFMPDYVNLETYLGAPIFYFDVPGEREYFELAYEDDVSSPHMTIYQTGRSTRCFALTFMMGAILDTYEAADTRVNGTALVASGASDSNAGVIINNFVSCRYGTHLGGGGAAVMSMSYTNIFSIENETNDSAEFLRAPIAVSDTNEIKGYLRNDVAFLVGAVNERLYQVFDFGGSYFIKSNNVFATPWHDQQGLPMPRWDLENAFPVD